MIDRQRNIKHEKFYRTAIIKFIKMYYLNESNELQELT